MNEELLRLALKIISGRLPVALLQPKQIEMLGLDEDDMVDNDILEEAEDVVFWAILEASNP